MRSRRLQALLFRGKRALAPCGAQGSPEHGTGGGGAEALVLAALAAAAAGAAFVAPDALGRAVLLAPLAAWAGVRFGVTGAIAFAAAVGAFAAAGAGLGGVAARAPGEAGLAVAALGATSVALAEVTGRLRRDRCRSRSSACRAAELVQEIRLFLTHAPLPVFLRDASGRFLAASRAYAELVGEPAPAVVGRTVEEVWGAARARSLRADDARVLATGDAVHGTFERRGRSYVTIRFRVGAPPSARVGGYVVDVTERKQTERALRLASVGALASGVAHEVNNPLSFLTANISFVAEELGSVAAQLAPGRLAEASSALDDARHGAQRVARIVRDLQRISPRHEEAPRVFEPRAALEPALELVRGRIRARAELEERLEATPRVLGSEAELSEALVNVLVNAIEAIPAGASTRRLVRVTSGTDLDGRAVIEVTDSGRAVPPVELPRLFDPFHGARGAGTTGLGLAVARAIVGRMGGEVEARCPEGAGTTIRLVLPPVLPEQSLALGPTPGGPASPEERRPAAAPIAP